MRVHTSLRSAFRFGMILAAGSVVTFGAARAHAGEIGPGSEIDRDPNRSGGNAALHFEYNQALPTSIETPAFGPDFAKIKIGLKVEPVKNGGPLFTIDMPKGAVVEATWGTDKKVQLKAATGSSTDGLIKVRHSLAPRVDLNIDKWGIKANFSYDATWLVNKIPGARFNYDSQATQQFAPWGFTAVDTKLNSPDLENSQLFSMDFSELPDFVADNASGYLGVRAVTKPTFSYKTTKAVMSGADGQISSATSQIAIDAIDGDFIELMTSVEGEMIVKGEVAIQPFIHVIKVAGYDVDSDIKYDVFAQPFETPATKVNYQAALVHIPMPNVHVPSKGVNVGDVKVGKSSTKTVKIENSGEKTASMKFKSTDGAFSVPEDTITVPPKGTYELLVRFTPESAEPVAAEIVVASNDADSPEQRFKIGANGADVGGDDDEIDLPRGGADSGCGCRSAGTTSSIPGWAGLGGLALGVVLLASRRRK